MPVVVVGFNDLLSSVSTCEHRTEDFGIVADIQLGFINLCHVATSIYMIKEGSTRDFDGSFSEEASHVGKNILCIFTLFSSIRHTKSTAVDRAVEGSVCDIERYVSIGLTQFLIVAVFGTTFFAF